MSEDFDYTAGDPIPEAALDAENLVLGSGETQYDPDKSEAENSFADMEPGTYLLKVVGFGKVDKKLKETYVNGAPTSYEALQVEVRFADSSNPRNRCRAWFTLPPASPLDLFRYNNGTNAGGKAQGFFAQQFFHFVDRLFPGGAGLQPTANGGKMLTPLSQSLSNWKDRLIYATIEMGREQKNPDGSAKLNPATQEPFPVRTQIRMYSYVPYVEGGPSPVKAAPKPTATSKPASRPVAHAAPANNFAAAGLGDI